MTAELVSEVEAADIDLRRVLAEMALRSIEGLRLYSPLPFANLFHQSKAPERIVWGGNRGGKTVSCAAETAFAVTGQDPHKKYPVSDGICYVVGKSGKEIAQKLYPVLFKPGAFRMIRDEYTKVWRSYDPGRERDVERFKETKPAPALIPRRFVKSIAWQSKKLGWPEMIRLVNGWTVHFYTSEGKPTQGTDIDLAWFDEEIIDTEWYPEIAARLIDRRGRFYWSATAQQGTERLYALHERADKETEDNVQPRTVEQFFCTMDGNKYISREDKETFANKLASDADDITYRVRVLGEFAILSGRVYPEYSPRLHEVDPHPIPPNWTKFVAIDPGRQTCAVLYGACPPPEEGDFFDIFDELYIHDCTAAIFGLAMGRKLQEHRASYRAFIIDMAEGRKHDVGGGKNILQQYSDALKANKVKAELTGYEFLAGNCNNKSGIEAVRWWLRLRQDGTAKLRIHKKCVNFIKEIKGYRNKQVTIQGRKEFVDDPVKSRDHLMDTLKYLVMFNPTWVQPKDAVIQSPVYAAWLKRQKEKNKEGLGDSMMLGPGKYNNASK